VNVFRSACAVPSLATLLRVERPDEAALADLDAAMAQDRESRRDVKIEVGQREIDEIGLPLERARLATDWQRDFPALRPVDLCLL
jgi:hypothetical protein